MSLCDFDNDSMTCPHCGAKAGGRLWLKGCDSDRPLPGLWLSRLIRQLGMKSTDSCSKCAAFAAKMNRWGVDGCREHRAEIVDRLRRSYKAIGWVELTAGMAKAVASGLAFSLDPFDPFGSLVDEAIRRAEAAQQKQDRDRGRPPIAALSNSGNYASDANSGPHSSSSTSTSSSSSLAALSAAK